MCVWGQANVPQCNQCQEKNQIERRLHSELACLSSTWFGASNLSQISRFSSNPKLQLFTSCYHIAYGHQHFWQNHHNKIDEVVPLIKLLTQHTEPHLTP